MGRNSAAARQTSPAFCPPPPPPHSLAALHERVFRLLPLQNLALGLNELDLAEAFDWSVVVVSKPLTTNPLPTDYLIGG
jgi:hypothetical protein